MIMDIVIANEEDYLGVHMTNEDVDANQTEKKGNRTGKNHTVRIAALLVFSCVLFFFSGYTWGNHASKASAVETVPAQIIPVDLPDYTLIQLPSESDIQSMGYVIVTKDNRVIVVDGGVIGSTDRLYEILAKFGGHVDAWLVTHPHIDHVTALENMQTLHPDITIDKIYGTLLDYDLAQTYEPDFADNVKTFNDYIATVSDRFQSVTTGMVITVGNLSIEVLQAGDPTETENYVNNQSVVYRIGTAEEKVLFLGDLGAEGGALLAQTYGDGLNTDIVQMAHHGQAGVTQDVYQLIFPKYCLWPTPAYQWMNEYQPGDPYDSGTSEIMTTRLWMDELSTQNIISKDGCAVLTVTGTSVIVAQYPDQTAYVHAT